MVVTDNAAVMKKAWRIARIECGGVYFLGCFCHALNLFFNDIFAKCHDKIKNSIIIEDDIDNDNLISLEDNEDWTVQMNNESPEDDILAEEDDDVRVRVRVS